MGRLQIFVLKENENITFPVGVHWRSCTESKCWSEGLNVYTSMASILSIQIEGNGKLSQVT